MARRSGQTYIQIMRRWILSIALPLAALTLAVAETPRVEKGSPKELRGVERICIASSDPAHVEMLSERLRAALPDLQIVDDPEQAEVMLVVTFQEETIAAAPQPAGACSSCGASAWKPPPQTMTRAVASVVRPVGPDCYRRLVASTWTGPAPPILCNQIVQHFAKAYRKANKG
jgi:hypothetical protein